MLLLKLLRPRRGGRRHPWRTTDCHIVRSTYWAWNFGFKLGFELDFTFSESSQSSKIGKRFQKPPQTSKKSSCGGSWQWLGRVLASELRLGRVLGASWRVLDASWGQLESSWKVLEASWRRFGSLRDVPGLVLGGSGGVFERFFDVFSRSQAKIEN